jgi:nucleotide-binding universal stress UspA family protein
MKKILIALDYNPSAEKVAEAGYTIAKAMNAEISIVHVITEAVYYNVEKLPFMGFYHGYNTGIPAVVRDIKREAENFLAASVKHLGDDNIKTMVLEGETANAILKYSEDWNADMIVMGSHRHHGLDRLLVSHVSAYVLTQSKIPLLTIPTYDTQAVNDTLQYS